MTQVKKVSNFIFYCRELTRILLLLLLLSTTYALNDGYGSVACQDPNTI